MELRTSTGTVLLASIGPDEVVPRTRVELDSGKAEIVINIDGNCFTWPVELPHGAVPFENAIKTRISGEMRRSIAES